MIDWSAEFWWIMVNIVTAAGGPWFANLFLYGIEAIGASPAHAQGPAPAASAPSVKWGPWDAYRDGQLGFVAVAWAAAALYDVGTHKCLYPNPGGVEFVLIASIIGGAVYAAQGARKPIRGTFSRKGTGVKSWFIERIAFYPAFSLTLFFALVPLVTMLQIHFTVLGHECKGA